MSRRSWPAATAGHRIHCCADTPRAHPNHNQRACRRRCSRPDAWAPAHSRAPRSRARAPLSAERKHMKKEILVSVDRGETRVAVLEGKGATVRGKGKNDTKRKKPAPGGDWKGAELYVKRRGRRSIVGNIYKGKVDNVLPGMEAAFVDIGLERNGFLHVDEIVMPGGQAVPKRGRGRGRRISELLKSGQEIIVQVVKDPLKTKGARLSMNLSIAGRYLVYAPQGSGVGVSRRLADKERERVRKMVERTYDGPGGLIVRTAAHGAKKADFVREIDYLHKLNEVLERRAKSGKAPALVF